MWGIQVGVHDPFEVHPTEQDSRGRIILHVQPPQKRFPRSSLLLLAFTIKEQFPCL